MVSVHQVIDHCFQTGLVMGALSRDSLEAAHVTCISSSIVLIGSGKQVSEMRKIGVQDLETDREKEGSIPGEVGVEEQLQKRQVTLLSCLGRLEGPTAGRLTDPGLASKAAER